VAITDAHRAYALIKEQIVTARMKPGAMIDEAALVSELGLGRTPIREACKRLEAEALVVVLPRRGMYVAEVTLAELRELEEVRLELESLSTRLAVQRMTPAQLSEMRLLLRELMGQETRPDNHEDGLDLDRRLHELVWRASQNSLLEEECRKMFDLSRRIWYLFIDGLEPSELHTEVFGEIAEAVDTHDQARAVDAIRDHILRFGESVRRHL
jgi:DNA-binding GntR family transcriptional regulator